MPEESCFPSLFHLLQPRPPLPVRVAQDIAVYKWKSEDISLFGALDWLSLWRLKKATQPPHTHKVGNGFGFSVGVECVWLKRGGEGRGVSCRPSGQVGSLCFHRGGRATDDMYLVPSTLKLVEVLACPGKDQFQFSGSTSLPETLPLCLLTLHPTLTLSPSACVCSPSPSPSHPETWCSMFLTSATSITGALISLIWPIVLLGMFSSPT